MLWRKTEIHLQSLLEATQRKQRSGHQHKAERDLNDYKHIAEGQAAAPPHCGSSPQHEIWIGFGSAPGRSRTKKPSGDKRTRQSKQENAPVRVDIVLHREIHRRAPAAQRV